MDWAGLFGFWDDGLAFHKADDLLGMVGVFEVGAQREDVGCFIAVVGGAVGAAGIDGGKLKIVREGP